MMPILLYEDYRRGPAKMNVGTFLQPRDCFIKAPGIQQTRERKHRGPSILTPPICNVLAYSLTMVSVILGFQGDPDGCDRFGNLKLAPHRSVGKVGGDRFCNLYIK